MIHNAKIGLDPICFISCTSGCIRPFTPTLPSILLEDWEANRLFCFFVKTSAKYFSDQEESTDTD